MAAEPVDVLTQLLADLEALEAAGRDDELQAFLVRHPDLVGSTLRLDGRTGRYCRADEG